jgi:GTPase
MAEELAAHRSGFVAVIGPANAGKSALLNAILRQKVAGVSPWPQTTRRRQLGILTLPEAQIIFMDTPGLHQPRNRLGRAMHAVAGETLARADVILYLADLERAATAEDRTLAAWVAEQSRGKTILLALTKADAVGESGRAQKISDWQSLFPGAEGLLISAFRGDGLADLLQRLAALLPEGPVLYPEEDITDLSEREIAADLVHEAALRHLRAEVPHGIAVRIDDYQERGTTGAFIEATLYVERESHKAIVIGRNGAMLRTIGADARRQIEAMNGRKVFLEIRVKTLPGWRDREPSLRRLGFLPAEETTDRD